MKWKILSTIKRGKQLREMMAASCIDGIGVIATWKLRNDGQWDVFAVTTEQSTPIFDWHEGEPVPRDPLSCIFA